MGFAALALWDSCPPPRFCSSRESVATAGYGLALTPGAGLQDLAMYINEVKRDKETLKKISEFQSSIENLVSVAPAVTTGMVDGAWLGAPVPWGPGM